MFQGRYNEKQKHDPDFDLVVERALAAGVERMIGGQISLALPTGGPRMHAGICSHPLCNGSISFGVFEDEAVGSNLVDNPLVQGGGKWRKEEERRGKKRKEEERGTGEERRREGRRGERKEDGGERTEEGKGIRGRREEGKEEGEMSSCGRLRPLFVFFSP